MPELPEVEAARRAVEEHCIGKKIKRALVADDAKVIDAVSPSDFEASLLGKTIVAAHRKGKNMWLQLDSPPFPTFQFGMAGAIYIKGVAVTKYKRSAVADTDEWPSKYSKVFMELDDGLELSFTDKRRFARVRLLQNPISVPPICELGPDALFEPMTTDEFFKSLSKKKTGIKALLLDQSFVSGIGNWIADEVLYQARIHPMQNAASISKESCAALHKCIKEVIHYAVKVDADCSHFPLDCLRDAQGFQFLLCPTPANIYGVNHIIQHMHKVTEHHHQQDTCHNSYIVRVNPKTTAAFQYSTNLHVQKNQTFMNIQTGYFVVDMDSTSDKLVFNRIVTSRVKYAKGGK